MRRSGPQTLQLPLAVLAHGERGLTLARAGMAPIVRGSSAVSPGPQGAMGRQRAPPGPCWRRLLRAGCWWLLSLCGTALRGLRGLWSLTWVGTTEPLPQGPPRTCAGSKRGAGAEPGQGGCWGAVAVPPVLGAVVCCNWGSWRRGVRHHNSRQLGCGIGTLVPGG